MRHLYFFILFALSNAFLPLNAYALPEIGKPAPDFTGSNYDGSPVKLSEYQGKIVVLEWTNPDCPFVKKHYESGAMQSLQKYALGKNVVWLTINSSAHDHQGYMDQLHAKEYLGQHPLIASRYLLDPEGEIGILYGAKTTPHMFVIDAQGVIAYMGAIDDKPTPDPISLHDAHNYVKAAIDSLLAGQKVEVTSTQSYGCSVKYDD